MTERQRLLLALCISQWQSTIDHLRANWKGVVTANQVFELEVDLRDLTERWGSSTEHPEQVLWEVRQYLTEHVEELDVLLTEVSEEAKAYDPSSA